VEREDLLTPLDALYLQRAYELAARGAENTSPNPPVGAVVVAEGRPIGEGYHHVAGSAHAEVNALEQAGGRTRGATLYTSLEPCRHQGRTPPCTGAVAKAGIARVVVGTSDPSGRGGASELRDRGITVTFADDAAARELIEAFAIAGARQRPYVTLKMAASRDGADARRPGVREQLTANEAQRYVRQLRIAHDAVMVGAGTVEIDDPLLTVRPAHDRLRPYVRVVVCGSRVPPARSRVFQRADGYERTIVLAPPALKDGLRELESISDVLYVGDRPTSQIDLALALKLLRKAGIDSVLCEGGPTLASSLIAAGQVDRLHWLIAPRFLSGDRAVPVLAGTDLAELQLRVRFDRVERAGEDVVLSGIFADV
jgi:diaminohydroxyphosphoribosylaminopyrimidine deaminase/5-amino-6-(5-phosphoribosylamino)uracil reductase